jgi:hypothetical protein
MQMNRTELLNYLIFQRKCRKYLEIGMHHERENFSFIRCEKKRIVPPEMAATFFSQTDEEFDLVFIDGLHTEERVLLDVEGAARCLTSGGLIVLHDCMPPDEWHQRDLESYRDGENWNGTVWKAALRIFNASFHACTLLDMDWGCGIIDCSRTQTPRGRKIPDGLDYRLHYSWLLEYKMNPAEYIREQLQVFFHLACMGNWKQVFREQMVQLRQNGFVSLDLTVLGNEEDLQFALMLCDQLMLKANLLFHSPELTLFEKPALLAIEKYAKEHEGYVLYLHSKGVSNPADWTKAKWRQMMMRELVSKWERCMLLLPGHDLIGVNWRNMPPTSHFCGNFWYASTCYLRDLADFNSYYENPRYNIWDSVNNKRLGCEFWIGSAGRNPQIQSLVYRDVDFCKPEFWRDK